MTEFPKVNPALNEKWLKRAAWWVKHRGQLRALLIGFVIFIDGVLIIFSGYGWVDFGLLSRQKERDMFLEMTKPPTILSLRGSIGPRDLAAPLVVTLSGSRQEGKYDALVKFVNPNNNYVAKIKFHGVGDAVTEPQSVVVLNNDERLAIIGGVARSSATNPRIIIDSIEWQYLREAAAINEKKVDFIITEATHELVDQGAANPAISQVKFLATNAGLGDYWSVEFMVILKQGDQELAAQTVTIDQFLSGEQRRAVLNFYGQVGSSASALVIPFVDVSDETSFIRTPGSSIKF